MSLKYFVHVSSISNLSDARYCSGMMVNSLGFNLDENSKNKLEIEKIISFLGSQNVKINDITTDDGDLEDVFIKLTKN